LPPFCLLFLKNKHFIIITNLSDLGSGKITRWT
jgi:hypothetical protein